ncbi:hypothetical protein FO519_004779 [Halicephalobus sp. NKZ332]|nr:hypothetical protein FO519_004779 [Halicephalobus sp. NKZ332]
MRIFLRWIFLSTLLVLPVEGEPLSLFVGSTIVAGFGYLGYVKEWHKMILECYGERRDLRNIEERLTTNFREKLFGQHLAVPILVNVVLQHKRNQRPRKALTLALHGITGTGKNYASSIIADALFDRGMGSRNVHLINGNLHNDDPAFINAFKADLFNWIKGNISTCGDSLFIFDEVDKLPVQVIDVIKPFVDHNTKIEGLDPKRAIFMFLSNTGSERINRHTLEHNQKQKSRESIPIIEIERIVQEAAFNQGDGGFKESALISHHLIDYFVPFLPLTREHVILCIKEYASRENIKLSQENIEAVASSLVYFPRNDPVFASSGCKQIEEKVNLFRFLPSYEL